MLKFFAKIDYFKNFTHGLSARNQPSILWMFLYMVVLWIRFMKRIPIMALLLVPNDPKIGIYFIRKAKREICTVKWPSKILRLYDMIFLKRVCNTLSNVWMFDHQMAKKKCMQHIRRVWNDCSWRGSKLSPSFNKRWMFVDAKGFVFVLY